MKCKGSHEIAQSNPRNQALKAKQMLNSRSEIGWVDSRKGGHVIPYTS